MALIFEPGFEGPLHQGTWQITFDDGTQLKLRGKYAALISLMVSGYRLRDDFQPLDCFDNDSLAPGRAAAKVEE